MPHLANVIPDLDSTQGKVRGAIESGEVARCALTDGSVGLVRTWSGRVCEWLPIRA